MDSGHHVDLMELYVWPSIHMWECSEGVTGGRKRFRKGLLWNWGLEVGQGHSVAPGSHVNTTKCLQGSTGAVSPT